MTFNEWLKDKTSELNTNRLYLANQSGITYRNLQTRNKGNPQLSNLVILCEVMNGIQNGDKASFDALLIEAIKACSDKYRIAVKRLEDRK